MCPPSTSRSVPFFALLCLALATGAHAETAENGSFGPAGPQPFEASPLAPAPSGALPPLEEDGLADDGFQIGKRDPNAYSIISVSRGLSTHRPMYMLPVAYGRGVEGLDTEMVFQISAKQRLFATNFFFGYTQKSFWQIYDQDRSRPFRETNYNPEVFYRWTPDPEVWHHWGVDVGLEHESNGQSLPESRSWNRVYVTRFRPRAATCVTSRSGTGCRRIARTTRWTPRAMTTLTFTVSWATPKRMCNANSAAAASAT